MIVTITLNPAIDKSFSVESMIPEKKLRCKNMQTEPGGGGINVSKALAELGTKSLAIFPSGGLNGQLLEEFMTGMNIEFRSLPITGETRESLTVDEAKSGSQYRFVFPGPSINQSDIENLFGLLSSIQPTPTYIVSSGSLPPGGPEDFFKQLAAYSKSINARCIIDTSGKPLELALQEGVFLLKPNMSELCLLAGKDRLELSEVDDAAMDIISKGESEVIVVSLGPSGALLVTRDGYEHIPAPTVKKQTTVGAGDSMVAGIIHKLSQGSTIKEAVQFGVACGTAATMNKGTELFRLEDVRKLFEWMVHHSEKQKLNFT
ncbi:MAG TPA: 1-phosphofructokinase family hexose kinase [Flavitalea sp.]|nr:1-phosphofructokinase family hexose kinase [Flavitalea sp.]